MTRKEALDILMSANVWNDEERTAWEVLVPELAESEDERIRRTLVEYFGPKVQLDFVRGVPIQKIRDWLEKQKEQKQEWSEEDEEMLEYVIGDLNDVKQLFSAKDAKDLCDKEIAWLKSLRPQYHGDVTMTEAYKMGKEAGEASHWKPSEEQQSGSSALKAEGTNE